MLINNIKAKSLQAVKYSIFLLATLFVLLPLYFLIVSAFKTDSDIFLRPFALPKEWLFENLRIVFVDNKFYLYMLNSFYYATLSILVISTTSIMASYALVRMKWKLSSTVNMLLMAGIMIPFHAVILPLYLNVRKMGIQSPRIVLIMIFAAFALPKSIFIISGFLKDIPKAIEESALIDGANIFTIITKLIIPLLKPAIATVCIFDFVGVWNDLLVGMIFVSKDIDKTLQLGIMKFMGIYVTMYNMIFVAVLIASIPTFLIFLFFQKQIIAGIASGAVKG